MDTPRPQEQDLLTDLVAAVAATRDQAPAPPAGDFSWEIDCDVLRGLILHAS